MQLIWQGYTEEIARENRRIYIDSFDGFPPVRCLKNGEEVMSYFVDGADYPKYATPIAWRAAELFNYFSHGLYKPKHFILSGIFLLLQSCLHRKALEQNNKG